MKNTHRLLLFIALFPLVYLVAALVLSNVYCNGYSAMGYATGQLFKPGGWGQSLRRFRELSQFGQVDLLFIGSSHAYRGFDPRLFTQGGYRSFNMGSSSQTPLNSYYLLKKYLPQLKPRLVVLEVYPVLLSKDGLESYLDLSSNLPLGREMCGMAFATSNLGAFNGLVRTAFERVRRPLEQAGQEEIDQERYVSGGYCETLLQKNEAPVGKAPEIKISNTQLKYLKALIAYVKDNNSDLLIVSQPLPAQYLKTIKNYQPLTKTIADLARDAGVAYIDYNTRLQLDPVYDFYDNDHLTPSGVKKFNSVVLQDLKALMGRRLAPAN